MKHAIRIFLMTAFLGFLMTSCDDGLYVIHNDELAKYGIPTDTIYDKWPKEPGNPFDTYGTGGNGCPGNGFDADVMSGPHDQK